MPARVTVALPPEVEQEFASIRSRNNVQPVTDADEGAPLAGLPDNIYGFTYSPLNESTPLFAKRSFQAFEVHKLGEGIVHLLGYVTPSDAALMTGNSEPAEIKLYPEPFGEASKIVQVSLERVVRAKPVSRGDGNYMPLVLDATA
jgi:hypothetical protein